MEASASSYRPHDPGHNYYQPGIYLITLVTRGRVAHFGRLNDDVRQPGVLLSAVGEAVMECWNSIPAHHAAKGRELKLHGAVCMPDHFHGVIEVVRAMDVPLGEVICGFKMGCTKAWRALGGVAAGGGGGVAAGGAGVGDGQQQRPCTAAAAAHDGVVAGGVVTGGGGVTTGGDGVTAGGDAGVTAGGGGCADQDVGPYMVPQTGGVDLHRMSKRQRALYYAAHPEVRQPLFDDNYDDTICLTDVETGQYDARHFGAMVRYVADNPRRAIVRRLNPQFMEHRQHVRIAGRDYAAFGNLFLLKWARKVQVFCHRRSPDGRSAYVDTEAFREDCRRWKAQVMEGATVLVTPGISAGELLIKNRCIESHYPLIHLQKEPLPPFKKPEDRRFDACAAGSLLILAPWGVDELGDYQGVPSGTEYSIFHNMNALAAEICGFEGEICWVRGE